MEIWLVSEGPEFVVNLTRGDDGTFGFTQKCGKVGVVRKRSPAYYNRVQADDQITRINNISIESMGTDKISSLLRDCKSQVTLRLCRIGNLNIFKKFRFSVNAFLLLEAPS